MLSSCAALAARARSTSSASRVTSSTRVIARTFE
jgi:hypothetical protein